MSLSPPLAAAAAAALLAVRAASKMYLEVYLRTAYVHGGFGVIYRQLYKVKSSGISHHHLLVLHRASFAVNFLLDYLSKETIESTRGHRVAKSILSEYKGGCEVGCRTKRNVSDL